MLLQEDDMNILVTLDRNYLSPFQTLLFSLLIHHPQEHLEIYLASSDITEEELWPAKQICAQFYGCLHLVRVPDTLFANAPTIRYYSCAMYYRLLAAEYLPVQLERILYLDPDMLVINPLDTLYSMDMGDALYAACIHKGLMDISSPVNRLRLSAYETEGYFNSGMLLMNLARIREEVRADDIFNYVKKNRQLLFLPDQDILNGLYGERIVPVDESLWNYDARKYNEYLIASSGEKDMDWVMRNTAILHFCGKRKPWHKDYHGRFSALYKHYRNLEERCEETIFQIEMED